MSDHQWRPGHSRCLRCGLHRLRAKLDGTACEVEGEDSPGPVADHTRDV